MRIGYINSRMMGKRLHHATEDARVINASKPPPPSCQPYFLAPHLSPPLVWLSGRLSAYRRDAQQKGAKGHPANELSSGCHRDDASMTALAGGRCRKQSVAHAGPGSINFEFGGARNVIVGQQKHDRFCCGPDVF
eukprot:1730624-Pyramimonas_sp.AAC.1